MTYTDDFRALLRADSTFMALIPGGLHEDPLDPDDPTTSGAWAEDPGSGILILQPSAVVLDVQEVDSPAALNPENRLDVDMWPEVVFYGERADMPDLILADQRAMAVVHNQYLGTALVQATGYKSKPMEADELPGSVWSFLRRFRIAASYHLEV